MCIYIGAYYVKEIISSSILYNFIYAAYIWGAATAKIYLWCESDNQFIVLNSLMNLSTV